MKLRALAHARTGDKGNTSNIALIAYKTQTHLQWDAAAERFTNSDAANALLSYEYRAPWKL